MLVAVLAARPGARIPLYVAIIGIERTAGNFTHNRHGDGRGVDAASGFGWWDALDTMPTSFMAEAFVTLNREQAIPGPFDGDVTLSTKPERKAQIGLGQINHEQLRVITALSGSYFQVHFQSPFPFVGEPDRHGKASTLLTRSPLYRQSGAITRLRPNLYRFCRLIHQIPLCKLFLGKAHWVNPAVEHPHWLATLRAFLMAEGRQGAIRQDAPNGLAAILVGALSDDAHMDVALL